jgi:hypothetical protein
MVLALLVLLLLVARAGRVRGPERLLPRLLLLLPRRPPSAPAGAGSAAPSAARCAAGGACRPLTAALLRPAFKRLNRLLAAIALLSAWHEVRHLAEKACQRTADWTRAEERAQRRQSATQQEQELAHCSHFDEGGGTPGAG